LQKGLQQCNPFAISTVLLDFPIEHDDKMQARLLTIVLAIWLAGSFASPVLAGKPGSVGCYRAADKVDCFLDKATTTFERVKNSGERADAAAELLYTLAVLGAENDRLLQQTMTIASQTPLPPYREMALLYAIDLYHFSLESPLSTASYAAATARFATLESSLQGHDLLDLYIGACSMVGWEDDFLGRWGEFIQDHCNEEKLLALNLASDYDRAWLLAMMPVAATVAGDRDNYVRYAGSALSWLEQARKAAAHSRNPDDRNFIDSMGAVMHSLNATSLDMFDQPDRANEAINQALRFVHNLERHDGISGKTTPLRRTLAEALYKAGRDREAKTIMKQMLTRIDKDPQGKRVPFAEQAAILALAANLADFVESGGANGVPAAETQNL
jgi:hypothetical protein